MEQYRRSVEKCKVTLHNFSSKFQNNNLFLEEQQNIIAACTENLVIIQSICFHPVTGDILQDEMLKAYEKAYEIEQAKWKVESSFQWYCNDREQQFIPCNGEQEEPEFLQWLNAISTLKHLYPKGGEPQEETIALSQIQSHIEFALYNLNHLHSILNNVCYNLQRAKDVANQPFIFPYLEIYTNLCYMDLSQFNAMDQTIWDLKMQIYQKYAFVITEQPLPVLMKVDRKSSSVQRDSKTKTTTTKTNISVKLLNIFEPMSLPSNLIPIKIRLINENEAQEIQRNKFREAMEFHEIPIYRCNSSAHNTTTSISSEPENFIATDLEMLEMGNAMIQTEYISKIFAARISNISVAKIKNGTKGKASNGKEVIKQKFYFLITAELPISHRGSFLTVTVWALSTPVILRSHSVHTKGALATTSWSKYFSDVSDNTQVRGYGTISEICNVLQADFQELTSYKDQSGKQASLSLKIGHLDFLIDMLYKQVCGEESHITKEEFINSGNVPLEFLYDKNLDKQRNFSIWSYFYNAAVIFKREYFRELWKNNYIIGFIGQSEAEVLLQRNGLRVGDFLIRFSQSVEAELCAVFVNHERKIVINRFELDKTTDKKLKITFLRNIYKSYWTGSKIQEAFITLYPHISKQVAFPGGLVIAPHQQKKPGTVAPYVYDKPTIAIATAAH